MNVVVCVKQVPDPNSMGQLDPSTHNLRREGVEVVLDPGDEFGVEAALQLAEASGGEVTVVSMTPDRGLEAIRKALAMGAARAVHISDPSLAGSDAITTARVLAAAIRRSPYDVVITATESTDGYTGVVPQAIAEFLGIPAVTFAKEVKVADGKVAVRRQTEAGFDLIETTTPCLVSVTAGINGVDNPRYPQLRGIMQAKTKPVEKLTCADLEVTGAGAAAAGQQIVEVTPAEERGAGEIITDDGTAAQRIVDFLVERKVI